MRSLVGSLMERRETTPDNFDHDETVAAAAYRSEERRRTFPTSRQGQLPWGDPEMQRSVWHWRENPQVSGLSSPRSGWHHGEEFRKKHKAAWRLAFPSKSHPRPVHRPIHVRHTCTATREKSGSFISRRRDRPSSPKGF